MPDWGAPCSTASALCFFSVLLLPKEPAADTSGSFSEPQMFCSKQMSLKVTSTFLLSLNEVSQSLVVLILWACWVLRESASLSPGLESTCTFSPWKPQIKGSSVSL